MCIQKYNQVESLVVKYVTLASQTETAKIARKEIDKTKDLPGLDVNWCFDAIDFTNQLLWHIYQLRAGDSVNEDVVQRYSHLTYSYFKELLSEEEEQFLVDNFDVFVQYTFNHLSCETFDGNPFDIPSEWSRMVPFLFEKHSGKIFVANSDYGREFSGLENCNLVVSGGFENAVIRALACGKGISVHKSINPSLINCQKLWSTFDDSEFDAVIIDMHTDDGILRGDTFVEENLKSCIRIVKEGGEIFVCLSKEAILGDKTISIRSFLLSNKYIREVIQLPSGNILLHIVKKAHNSIVMCDASFLSDKHNEKIVDVEAFLQVRRKIEISDCEDPMVAQTFNYDLLLENILLPTYYLGFPKSGTSLEELTTVETELVLSDECASNERVVTINHLSDVFTKGEFSVDNLSILKQDRLRRYFRVKGPAVILAVSSKNLAIGYTTSSTSFLVPYNLYALKPKSGLDVKYLASKLLSKPLKTQLKTLVYGEGIQAKLVRDWRNVVLMDLQSTEEQQQFVQKNMFEDFAIQEDFLKKQEKGFKHAVRLRKHALSQNISAFDSLFRSLEYCMNEHRGHLKSTDRISPISSLTVGETMSRLHSDLEVICERVARLTDDNDWGKCEALEPQQFIENYEKTHKSPIFKFVHLWNFRNHFNDDVLHKETGKLLFHKGEPMSAAWFPKKALMQVFDNIVSNACEHGFKTLSEKKYVIQTNWYTDGLNMIIEVSNNGIPIPSDVNSDLVLEYGYSTALNHKGHSGIGGGEISQIMHKYGGGVRILSTPEKEFTVTYLLTIPLASIY